MATEKRPTQQEINKLQKELLDLLLKKADIKLEDIYETAVKRWVAHNLDLLSPEELKKYKGKVIA